MVRGQRPVEGMVNSADAWKSRRVFLTGHTGFKGSWLALWLQQFGSEVLGYSLEPPSQPSLFEVAEVARGMQSMHGNICDLLALKSRMAGFQPEVVFHLAAQSLVHKSYEEPIETYATNVMGTVNVLEAVRSTPSVRAVVVVTSDKCYENNERVWGYRETDPMGGYDPYSNSKGCAELVASAYRRSYFHPDAHAKHGVAVASARAGNVIGGGDWARDRLIPDFVRSIEARRPLQIRRPGAVRPWQHVLDPLSGYLSLAERLLQPGGAGYASGWNFGPDDDAAIPVSSVVDKFSDSWGGAPYEITGGEQPHEAQFLKLDCSKARAQLQWSSRLDVDAAISWTADWYKAKLKGSVDMRKLTVDQIKRFRDLPQ